MPGGYDIGSESRRAHLHERFEDADFSVVAARWLLTRGVMSRPPDEPNIAAQNMPEREIRVRSWFRTQGLGDDEQLERASHEVARLMDDEGLENPALAARVCVERWLASVTSDPIPGGALERLLETEPQLLFDSHPDQRARARRYLVAPAELPFAGRWRPADWPIGRALVPAASLGAIGSLLFLWAQAQDNGGVFGALAALVLFVLTTVHALGMVLVIWGAHIRARRAESEVRTIRRIESPIETPSGPTATSDAGESGTRTLEDAIARSSANDGVDILPQPSVARSSAAAVPRSALILFLYGEDTERIFPALAAMRDELSRSPDAKNLELFILSDTREAMLVMEERRCVRRLRREPGIPVYYRRRDENTNYKTGNFAEFLMRWGNRYEFIGVLDADSIIPTRPLLSAFRRIADSPRLGLVQLPIEPIGARSLFARTLQFDATLVGPYHTSGLAAWAGPVGNYYGHNAVIRTQAFIDTCALPRLTGTPPLGGLVLSHDFVEAAALARAGWEVRIADDLEPSYEELPATVEGYLDRDRRWCQGNLQHLRIMGTHGLRGMSRLHLFLGALSYLASPIWLTFIILMALAGTLSSPSMLEVAILVGSLTLLLVPRLVSVLAAAPTRAFGHPARLTLSALLETVLMALLAPIFMIHHTVMVSTALVGGAVGWTSKKNRKGGGMMEMMARHALVTGVGAAGLSLTTWDPALGLWLSPIWIPCLFAIPIVLMMNSESLGGLISKLGALQTPVERAPLPIFDQVEAWRPAFAADEAVCFRDLILEPTTARELRVMGSPTDSPPKKLEALQLAVLERGAAAIGARERNQLLADPGAMARLHEGAWARWPLRSMSLTSEPPLTPPPAPVEARARLHSITGDAA